MPKDKYTLANRTIDGLIKLPMVRVSRKNFLKTQFKDDENLKGILKNGPQAYYSANELRDMADLLIKDNVTKAASASVLAGLPSNPLIMLGTGAADIAQYFGLALRMAQTISVPFGEDDLFNPKSHLSEVERGRLLGLLGAMFGVSGATSLIYLGSQKMAEPIGNKIAGKAVLEGVKHPIMKKVGSTVGHKISHQTLGQTMTKAVPLVGGVTSGVITYVTFKPMGQRLANLLADNLAAQQAQTETVKQSEKSK